jgi:Cytochrome c7 and related cytochrome c
MQIFPRSSNAIARASMFGAVFAVAGLFWVLAQLQRSPYVTYAGVRKSQPVPFSHQHHVTGLGIDCRYCHTSVEESSFAGIPPTKTCMNCHSQIWTNAAYLEPVRESFRSGKSLEWTRVNQLPDFVYFNHSIHINKGVGCNTCHGPVDQMPLTYQYASLQMEFCLDCHRSPEKYLRPREREEVFNMRYQPPSGNNPVEFNGTVYTDQLELGNALKKAYKVRSVRDITSCNTCHR